VRLSHATPAGFAWKVQVNNENFWIAVLAVVAYVLFARNVCCYNGSRNQSRVIVVAFADKPLAVERNFCLLSA